MKRIRKGVPQIETYGRVVYTNSYCNNSIHKGRRFSGPASLCFLCHLKKYGAALRVAMAYNAKPPGPFG